MEAWKLIMEPWRDCRPVAADSVSLTSRIRIRFKVKKQVRILINEKFGS
jgi:hypothetical protein